MNYYLRNKDEIDSRMLFFLLFFLGPHKTFLCLENYTVVPKNSVLKKICGVCDHFTKLHGYRYPPCIFIQKILCQNGIYNVNYFINFSPYIKTSQSQLLYIKFIHSS